MKYELYELLGVESEATQAEITKAFRLRALSVHPDKNPDDAESATEKFQLLQKAFEVLKDPKKRKYYDETGDISDTSDEFEDLYSRFRSRFVEVTPSDIELFSQQYKGSDDEQEDILSYLKQYKGDLTNFFFCVPLAEADEADRFAAVIKQQVKAKKFNETKAFCKSFAEFNDTAKAWSRKSKSEAKKAAKHTTAAKASKPGEPDVTDINALALAIKANQARRSNQSSTMWSSFMDKYSEPEAGSKTGAKTKATASSSSTGAGDQADDAAVDEDVPVKNKAVPRPVRVKRGKGAHVRATEAKKTKK